ncbi:hypothetical protein [Microbispora bryophytorum]|nr:hypothetical protein [Microbispora bryophytorum]MBD3140239.1 hypothetical protein [Microbispora bryophytorum]
MLQPTATVRLAGLDVDARRGGKVLPGGPHHQGVTGRVAAEVATAFA